MMRPANDGPAVYLCRDPIDFRKGINGLAILVEQVLVQNPFSEQLFVFCNRRRDRIKILYWERSGFCLWQKRLEQARFHWPRKEREGVITLTPQQLNWLLDGYDISRLQPHQKLAFNTVL
jgi:transposase